MNKMETTPDEISYKIIELCNMIVPDSSPIYVSVCEDRTASMNECFPNVDKIVILKGGRRVNGWCIWKFANILIEAEAHAVWKDESGNLIDITPHNGGEKQILFLPDNNLVYEGKNIDNVRMPLTNSHLVKEYISLNEELFAIVASYKPHEMVDVEDLPKQYFVICDRLHELGILFHTKVERNDKCPCGSGLKYKKCCGK